MVAIGYRDSGGRVCHWRLMVAIGYRDSGGRECGRHQEVTPDAGRSLVSINHQRGLPFCCNIKSQCWLMTCDVV